MKNNGLKPCERETIISFSDDSDSASIWTSSEKIEKKLIANGLKVENYGHGIRSFIPKGWIKLVKPTKNRS